MSRRRHCGCTSWLGSFSGLHATSSSTFTPRLVFHVCLKPGHTAILCYHCFNQTFQAFPPSSFTANYISFSPSFAPYHVWFFDTAATHHFTSDAQHLNLDSIPYHDLEQVSIGDGLTLSIHNTGSTQMTTSSGKFLLHNLLHVPNISRNLLSIRQFCSDNHTLNFTPLSFCEGFMHSGASSLELC